jgi:hypothetical protein
MQKKLLLKQKRIEKLHQKRAEEKGMKNQTYKNADRVKKTFELGQIVAH